MEREVIHSKLIESLKANEHVHLILEGGSKAFNRFDEFSDIDLMIGVDDEKVNAVFLQIEDLLEKLTGIEATYVPVANKGFHQRFYKLKDTSPYHVVDLYIIEHSVEDKQLEAEIHGDMVVYHDRDDYMKKQVFDSTAFDQKVELYRDKMKRTFEFYGYLSEKEMDRGRYLDALAFYFDFTLKPLMRLLRIKYHPHHYNFEMRYLYDELPEYLVKELEQLFSVADIHDLRIKHKRVKDLYHKEIV